MSKKLFCVYLACALVPLAFAQDRGKGSSFEEIFMGLHRPFNKRGEQPKPGSSPSETAKALYGNEVFFNLRNSFQKPITDYLAPCFSKSLLGHFEASREAIERWFEQNKNTGMKLPMGEGAIFVSCYEGATSFRIGETVIDHEKAKVAIHLTYIELGTKFEWTDIALLTHAANLWLLDDIVFDPSRQTGYTLRKRTSLEDKP